MVRTNSNMLELGTTAPSFQLEDVLSQTLVSLEQEPKAKALVIMFICNHCPYVKHIMDEVVSLAKAYQPQGISFIAINSNDVSQYPEDSPAHMVEFAKMHQFSFPYLFDETQEVAEAYKAACTPDFYVFDKDKALVYRGQLDGSRPGNDIKPNGESIRQALDCILAHKPVDALQYPSLGCNIKWKA